MKTLLVTGGAGFIGSNFIRYMLAKHDDIRVINLDKLTYAGNLNNLKDIEEDSRYRFVKGDICDEGVVEKLVKESDVILNFAAESHVDRSIGRPDDFMLVAPCLHARISRPTVCVDCGSGFYSLYDGRLQAVSRSVSDTAKANPSYSFSVFL